MTKFTSWSAFSFAHTYTIEKTSPIPRNGMPMKAPITSRAAPLTISITRKSAGVLKLLASSCVLCCFLYRHRRVVAASGALPRRRDAPPVDGASRARQGGGLAAHKIIMCIKKPKPSGPRKKKLVTIRHTWAHAAGAS